jgi:carbonic anhydrase
MSTHYHEQIPRDITPSDALTLLKKGNFRFINNLKINRDLLEQVNETKEGQWPFATILSCIDSRTSAELIFDQGLGDIFSVRIAGNVISEYILGSLEFATAVAQSKLIVVLGHTNCGAIKGACDNVKLGNLTALLDAIQPAVEMETTIHENRNGENMEFVNAVARLNVKHAIQEIISRSEIIKNLVEEKKLGIVPAMYNVATGKVTFYESDSVIKKARETELSHKHA